MKTNCINCGAPIDIDADKCPYCKTSYFDMTAIDFNSREPIALKIRNCNMIITQLVRPVCGNVEYGCDTVDMIGPYGTVGYSATLNRYAEINIQFEALRRPSKGSLMEVIVYDD